MFGRVAVLIAALLLAQGCAFTKLEREVTDFAQQVIVWGRVIDDVDATAPVIVVLYRQHGGRITVADYRRFARPGPFAIMVPRGEYRVAAFEDRNGNTAYDAGEAAGSAGFVSAGKAQGTDFDGVEIRIAATGVLPAPFARDQLASTGQRTRLADLDPQADLNEPRFGAAYGRMGLWEPLSFLKEVRGGVYFLEPYSPDKTPVVFVHGAGGTPDDWRYFIEHLDRTRYQPWVFFYPSGLPLEVCASWLNKIVAGLHAKYGFERLIVTAHSMGGLVARRFVALNAERGGPGYEQLLVTLATPFGGVPVAQLGVDLAPYAIPSWNDITPNSRFLQTLRTERPPASVTHHLFYAYRGRASGDDSDGMISVASQMQSEAVHRYGFKADHVGILSSAAAFERYVEILDGFECSHRPGEFASC